MPSPAPAIAAPARSGTFTNPVITDTHGRDHGDPFVLRYLDEYFLYHTTDDGDSGISVHRSSDLVNWEFAGYALEGAGAGHWAQTDLWAPEVMYWRGCFYMYFAATVFGAKGHGDNTRRRVGVARADHPLGPFTPDPKPLIPHEYAIDAHPFQDEDGSLWLFYNVRRSELSFNGLPSSANVVDRLITPTQLAGEVTPVAVPSERWEGSLDGSSYWNEGCWVLKRRGRYHQLYSGSHYRDGSYAIGLSGADVIRGEWTKYPRNPIFATGERITGPGHHSVILAPDGVTYYAVYHGYDSGRPGRKVHLDPLRWCGDQPVMGTGSVLGRPTETPQPVPGQPVYDPDVPFWHADLWVQGSELRVGRAVVALPESEDRPLRARVNQGRDGLRVWIDNSLAAQDDGRHSPDLAADGEIVTASLTSHFDDEALRWLAPGEHRRWEWGGSGPLEVSIAVRGTATVSAGDESIEVRGNGEYALGVMRAQGGAREIVVEAGPAGAHVTDLAVTAR